MHELRPRRGEGHEQRGRRFGVVVQSDLLLPRSLILVAPTSRSASATSFRPLIELAAGTTRVLVEQTGAIDAHRLGKRVARLGAQDLWMIDDALGVVLGLG